MATHSNGISALQLQKQLALGSYKSAWLLCAKLRRAMVAPNRALLSGLAEVDETELPLRTKDDPVTGGGGRSGQSKMLVAGAVEVADGVVGRIRLAKISNSSAKSLHGFVEDNIAPGTTIKTDGWSAYPNVTFDFLGYQFRPRRVANSQRTEFFCGYTPAVSRGALKSIRATIRSLNIPRQTPGTLAEIAEQINPLLRGWFGYYGRFSPSDLATLADYVNQKLKGRVMRKYKRFWFHKTRANLFLRKLARENADLFVHWQTFGTNPFA